MDRSIVLGRRALISLLVAAGASISLPALAVDDDLSPEAFQRLMIEIGARRYPSLPMRPGPSSHEILWGDHHLYLYNAYETARRLPPAIRERAVLDFIARFSPEADAHNEAIKTAAEHWSKARPLLRPKLYPIATIRQAPWLLNRPFTSSLCIGYTIDLGESDMYVDDRWLKLWDQPIDTIHDEALKNLEAMSGGVKLASKLPSPGAIAIATGDGYDAPRILLPSLRARLIEILGPTILAGLPARDFFFAWPAALPNRRDYEASIAKMAAVMPHALTNEIFLIDRLGVRSASATEL